MATTEATRPVRGSRQRPSEPVRFSIVTVAGPTAVAMDLVPPGPLTVGRRPGHDLQLGDPASRDHALLVWEEPGHWCIIDTNSRHGTRLNGEPLTPQTRYPLQHDDLIQMAHWTLQFIDPAKHRTDSTLVRVVQDEPEAGATISEVRGSDIVHPSQRHLALLLECAHTIHRAKDTPALAEAVLNALVLGTGLPNAAFIKPLAAAEGDDAVSVLAHRGAILSNNGRPNLSRSLIERAGSGVPVRLNRSQQQMIYGASILELGIDEAMCAPIMLGSTVAGFIYLDSRGSTMGGEGARITSSAADFAIGLTELAAMAMANLKRLDLERRCARIEADIAAAAEAQRWILPKRHGEFRIAEHTGIRLLTYVGESRPGKVVSGDFFDVIPLSGDRLAVTLGDVSGKGVAASVLMTVAQGFLHAALLEHGDPARAARDLNEYVQPRCAAGRFVTLWIGVFDPRAGSITYVDAGHGYAFLRCDVEGQEPQLTRLNERANLPVGVVCGTHYENARAPQAPGCRVLIVSDGLVEQTGSPPPIPASNEEFGVNRIRSILASIRSGEDEVAAIFERVDRFAGRPLADDATAVLVRNE